MFVPNAAKSNTKLTKYALQEVFLLKSSTYKTEISPLFRVDISNCTNVVQILSETLLVFLQIKIGDFYFFQKKYI